MNNIVIANNGALFGVADYTDESDGEYPNAISVALVLSRGVLDTIKDEPTRVYQYHYRIANTLLDHIALKLVNAIETSGYRSFQVPASQVTDWNEMRGEISHRYIAVKAGLGYLGRSTLLVTPRYGAQVRLVSVFTDMPLVTDEPFAGDCGDCRACVKPCPAGAIGETTDDFDRDACLEKLRYFKKHLIGQHICGVCVKNCAGHRGIRR
ncbi:MAG: epoxyqueuosine reductase [bacterium]|nr:epoxyqueuosine reductase [bacterium]